MPRLLRRLGPMVLAAAISGTVLAGICTAGVATSMAQSFPAPPPTARTQSWPPAASVPAGRITVAVVTGSTGSVAADVLAPYEVFARSERFFVYTVAASRTPAAVSGGLHLLPDHTFDEAMPAPDVVVVPAVADPAGAQEAPLRAWVAAQVARGSRILGVCAGSEVLAASGVLDGRGATSFWSRIDSLQRSYPETHWTRGQRYVQDGPVTTTAGVTSGVVGALRLVEQLAGAGQARRVGEALSYPGWSMGAGTEIPVHRYEFADLPYGLNAAFPWLRPTVGVGLVDGVGEIDVAAAMEVYSGVSFPTRAVPIGAGHTVTTRHGLVLVVHPADATAPPVDRFVVPGVSRRSDVDPEILRWAGERGTDVEPTGGSDGEFGFDPVLRDLARHADRATAAATAKFAEYPSAHLDLDGPAWPWRSTALAVACVVGSVSLGVLALRARRVLPGLGDRDRRKEEG